MSWCCIPSSQKDKDIPAVDVDVSVDVSGCNCCAMTSKKKKKKTKNTIQTNKVDQPQEVEKTDRKVQRSSTTIIFMSHDESKSEEK